jgi:hypothetical protein
LRKPDVRSIRTLAALLLSSCLVLAPLRTRSIRAVVAIVVAAISTACTNSDETPLCDQGVDDVCMPCTQDTDCKAASQPGEVCASDGACWPPNEVGTVMVNWTIGGEPANATTCEGLPSELGFVIQPSGCSFCDEEIYSPMVSCSAGMLVQDRVPNYLIIPDDFTIEAQTGEVQLLDSPWGDQPGVVNFDLACIQDSECGAGDVCSILGTCQPASDVETVQVTWTVDGQPATASSCAGLDPLTLQIGNAHAYGTSVTCEVGELTASKVPTDLQTVLIYGGSADNLLGSAGLVNGSATLDLMP